jgi:NitT/TauT family transport system ATP-binding protein
MSFQIEDKKIIGIIADSGVGKTTFLRILAGLERYEKGSISSIMDKRIAYVFQEDRLLPWLTVKENIEFVLEGVVNKDQMQQSILFWLTKLYLYEVRDLYPKALSGGMRRRVALARAFCYPYDLLLLDEPFKGLQKELRHEIMTALLKQNQKSPKAILWSGHDVEELKPYAHEIYRLKEGIFTKQAN